MFLFVLGALAVIVGIVSVLYVLKKCKNGTYPSQKKIGSAVGALALIVGVALISMSCMIHSDGTYRNRDDFRTGGELYI